MCVCVQNYVYIIVYIYIYIPELSIPTQLLPVLSKKIWPDLEKADLSPVLSASGPVRSSLSGPWHQRDDDLNRDGICPKSRENP